MLSMWNLVLELEGAASAALPVTPVEYEQVPLVCGPEVGYIYSVGTDFCFRMPDVIRLDEGVDELMGIRSSDDPGNIRVYTRKEVGSGIGCFGGSPC